MIGLIQRVTQASVTVDGTAVGSIGKGILLLLGVERGDTPEHARRLLEKVTGYRIFPDAQARMNLSLQQVNGGLLVVPQFTLPADTRKGMRPSFTPAAQPALGQQLFDHFCLLAGQSLPQVQTGRFGADMQVALVNDGPVTFWLTV